MIEINGHKFTEEQLLDLQGKYDWFDDYVDGIKYSTTPGSLK